MTPDGSVAVVLAAVNEMLSAVVPIATEVHDAVQFGHPAFFERAHYQELTQAIERLREARHALASQPDLATTVIDGRRFTVHPIAGVGPNGSNCVFLRPAKEAS